MFERIVVDGLSIATQNEWSDYPLYPEESNCLGSVVAKRRLEFATGRHCARRAIAKLGFASHPIRIGPGREPVWPEGITGSITHCLGYCAAVVGRSSHFTSIGIDAEENAPLPDGVLQVISSDQERFEMQVEPAGLICWDRLLFSAKESVFKAWYSITQQWLDFEDCEVSWDLTKCVQSQEIPLFEGGFTAKLAKTYTISSTSFDRFYGRFVSDGVHLATMIVVRKPVFQVF